jgi:hypothetical protein
MSILANARQAGHAGLTSAVSRGTRTIGLAPTPPWLPARRTLRARLFRHGLEAPTGVPWIDESGMDDARVRLVYGSSVTGGAVAVTALALRVDLTDGSAGDLLLRAPGRPPWSRPGARRLVGDTMLTPATPYVVRGGLLSLGARQCGTETFELCCATSESGWRGFADLRISPSVDGTGRLRLDPARNPLPGLATSVPAPRAR